ncbi:hypothetical protein, partial [Salipiger abyssi]
MTSLTDTQRRQHDALHLAHRWFAFFEAPDRALPPHLEIFAPQVRLTETARFGPPRPDVSIWVSPVVIGVVIDVVCGEVRDARRGLSWRRATA